MKWIAGPAARVVGRRPVRRWTSWACAGLAALFALSLAGAAAPASYIDSTLGEIKPQDKVAVASPQPVELLFQFQTKGALNARATKLLKDKVVEAVKSTGVFSQVSDTPTANGAVLEVIINDAPSSGDMSSAEGKGFVTGATFFVAGSTIRENYDCTINYVAGPGAAKLTRTANDGVYFQMGLINSPPENAVKIGSLKEAIFAMARFIIINPLNALAGDPGFQTAATGAPPPAAQPNVTADAAQTPGANPTPAPTPSPTPGPTPGAATPTPDQTKTTTP
jgi:hypothetical protein